jgi:pyruvate dehydrogenase (quinone)
MPSIRAGLAVALQHQVRGIHLLNGLYDAKLDGAPVVAITGLQFHDLLHTYTQQDVELDKLFMDVCVYNSRVMGPAHVENVTELACRTALAYRGVSHITIPTDLQSLSIKDDWRTPRNVQHHVSDYMAESAHMPGEAHLQVASEILNEGKKVCFLAGRGAINARDQLTAMAERLGAAVAKPLLGKGALPDNSPFSVGGVGLLGTKPAQEALEECDTLLIAGSCFPYIEFYPKPGRAKCVQIDIDPKRIGLRYPAHIGLVGDCARVLGALLPKVQPKQDRTFLVQAQHRMKEWRQLMQERGTRRDKPMKPQVVAYELTDASPTMQSSPPIPGRSRPGSRATSTSAGISSFPVRVTLPPWLAASLTPSRRRSPIPAANRLPSSAMAASPC